MLYSDIRMISGCLGLMMVSILTSMLMVRLVICVDIDVRRHRPDLARQVLVCGELYVLC